MSESILSVSLAGLIAGFIFAMPIAGPISILITTSALKGRLSYCNMVSIGASLADFAYVFIAVFGLTKLYSYYKPAMPYIFILGSLFFFFLGYKIIGTKIDIENLEERSKLTHRIQEKEKGAFYTGFMINFLNPTLFIGVLTSSFFVISLLASLGLNTGGLAGKMDQHLKEINSIEGIITVKPGSSPLQQLGNLKFGENKDPIPDNNVYPEYFHLLISVCYALFLSLGSILWFLLMSYMIVRYRSRISIKTISVFIRSLGTMLCLFGVYFGYRAVEMLL